MLADRLGIPLTDYAVCMAMSDHYTLLPSAVFDNTGLLGQIDQFEKNLNGKETDPNALYTIQIGGVDFISQWHLEYSYHCDQQYHYRNPVAGRAWGEAHFGWECVEYEQIPRNYGNGDC